MSGNIHSIILDAYDVWQNAHKIYKIVTACFDSLMIRLSPQVEDTSLQHPYAPGFKEGWHESGFQASGFQMFFCFLLNVDLP